MILEPYGVRPSPGKRCLSHSQSPLIKVLAGPPRDILTGFLAPDERVSYGRPVGVTLGPDGSVLVADDVGDVIWRVTGERQG